MQNKVSFILQGAVSDNAFDKIFASLKRFPVSKFDFETVVIAYEAENQKVKEACKEYINKYHIRFVICKDLLNPGYFNLNRQLYTVKSALETVEKDRFVIKLRNDQWINWKKLFKIFDKIDYLKGKTQKIISTNCFTRRDRLYHPSDMFLCGWQPDLLDYFSCPLMTDTHMNCQLKMLERLRKTSDEFYSFLISPESELFRHYLEEKGWKLKNTFEDSYLALKTYCWIINTWDINLRWNKQRNADLPKGTIILPYTFKLEPFAGAPKEDAKCYSRHDFEGHKTFRDVCFLAFSRIVFACKYSVKGKIKHFALRVFYSRFFPRGLFKFCKCLPFAHSIKRFLLN